MSPLKYIILYALLGLFCYLTPFSLLRYRGLVKIWYENQYKYYINLIIPHVLIGKHIQLESSIYLINNKNGSISLFKNISFLKCVPLMMHKSIIPTS